MLKYFFLFFLHFYFHLPKPCVWWESVIIYLWNIGFSKDFHTNQLNIFDDLFIIRVSIGPLFNTFLIDNIDAHYREQFANKFVLKCLKPKPNRYNEWLIIWRRRKCKRKSEIRSIGIDSGWNDGQHSTKNKRKVTNLGKFIFFY